MERTAERTASEEVVLERISLEAASPLEDPMEGQVTVDSCTDIRLIRTGR
jgi:hypothetical protein